MSWTDIFPVVDEAMVEEYEAAVAKNDRADYEEWFGVKERHASGRTGLAAGGVGGSEGAKTDESQARDGRKAGVPPRQIVSATLFWKHVNSADPELPVPNLEYLIDARRLGLVKRFSPWESYIEPLVMHSATAIAANPDVEFRLYLGSDLAFLIPTLNDLGWEIFLMNSPSVRYCPGGFWRFLALEEAGAMVTIIDTDRMGEVSNEIQRTRCMAEMALGLWRVPGYYNSDLTKQVRYRPILGGHFGALGGIPVRRLIECFMWHTRRGTLRRSALIPGVGEVPIQFSRWPDYGFDEWFQLVALYPWLAPSGTLTFIPLDARSILLPADIEYATWANPRSELIYF